MSKKEVVETALERIDALAAKGKLPNYVELENALLQALEERKFFLDCTTEMTDWLARIAIAHVTCNGDALRTTLNEFIRERCAVKAESLVH